MLLHEQGLDDIIVDKLRLQAPPADLAEWRHVVSTKMNPEAQVNVAMVGKYVQIRDSYISLNEALTHAGVRTRTRVNVHYVEAADLEMQGIGALDGMDAILVPGGFGERGIEGKIRAVEYARRNGIPVSGHLSRDAGGGDRVRAPCGRARGRATAPNSIGLRRIR